MEPWKIGPERADGGICISVVGLVWYDEPEGVKLGFVFTDRNSVDNFSAPAVPRARGFTRYWCHYTISQ
jgi:hypothetical protein